MYLLLEIIKVEHFRLCRASRGSQGFAVRVRFFWSGIKMELGIGLDDDVEVALTRV